jgi:hypothetical protein
LELTKEEASLLVDTIDQAIEGHKESKRLAENDPSFGELETFTDVMNEHDDTIDTLKRIRERIQHDSQRDALPQRRSANRKRW